MSLLGTNLHPTSVLILVSQHFVFNYDVVFSMYEALLYFLLKFKLSNDKTKITYIENILLHEHEIQLRIYLSQST